MNLQTQNRIFNNMRDRTPDNDAMLTAQQQSHKTGGLAAKCLAGFIYTENVINEIDANKAQSKANASFVFYHELTDMLGPLNSSKTQDNIASLSMTDKKAIVRGAYMENIISENLFDKISNNDNPALLNQVVLRIAQQCQNRLDKITDAMTSEINDFKENSAKSSLFQSSQFKNN